MINTRPQSIQLNHQFEDELGQIQLTQPGIYKVDLVLFVPENESRPVVSLKLDEGIVARTIDSGANVHLS